MKLLCLLLLPAILFLPSCQSFLKTSIATVDINKIEERIGNKIALIIANREELDLLLSLNQQIDQAKKRMADRKEMRAIEEDNEEIENISAEYESALYNLQGRSDTQKKIKDFIIENFGERFSCIVDGDSYFADEREIISDNIGYVDITDQVLKLLNDKCNMYLQE